MKRSVIVLLLLTACSQEKEAPKLPSQPSKPVYQQQKETSGESVKCIDGASYEIKYGGAFLRFKDGRYVTC